jgi:hypothetical protein
MQVADRAYDELIDFFARGSSPGDVVDFRPSAHTQERASYLLARNRSGEITADEAGELERFGQLEQFMQLVKARARLITNTTT